MEAMMRAAVAMVGIGITADILLKCIDYLYLRHEDLLTKPQRFTGFSYRRFVLLYAMIAGVGLLLLGKNMQSLAFTVNFLFSVFLIIVIVTDYEQQLIFDRILLGLTLMVLLFTPLIEASMLNRVLAALFGGGLMLILAMVTNGAIGGGDIKLLFVLGLWQGLESLIFIFMIGFCGGGLAAALLLIFKRKKRRDMFAYGPYFALGALVNLFYL